MLWLVSPGSVGGVGVDGDHLYPGGGPVRESSLSDLCAVESLELDEPLIADDAGRRQSDQGRGGKFGPGGRSGSWGRAEIVLCGPSLPLPGACSNWWCTNMTTHALVPVLCCCGCFRLVCML